MFVHIYIYIHIIDISLSLSLSVYAYLLQKCMQVFIFRSCRVASDLTQYAPRRSGGEMTWQVSSTRTKAAPGSTMVLSENRWSQSLNIHLSPHTIIQTIRFCDARHDSGVHASASSWHSRPRIFGILRLFPYSESVNCQKALPVTADCHAESIQSSGMWRGTQHPRVV